jgi:hypothetical protein
MIFARRKGEILFKPVVRVSLTLAGEENSWVRKMFLEGPKDSGEAFKSQYLNEWAVKPPEPRIRKKPYMTPRAAKDLGFLFYNNPKIKVIVAQPPEYLMDPKTGTIGAPCEEVSPQELRAMYPTLNPQTPSAIVSSPKENLTGI